MRLTDAMYQELESAADGVGKSMSVLIGEALQRYLPDGPTKDNEQLDLDVDRQLLEAS